MVVTDDEDEDEDDINAFIDDEDDDDNQPRASSNMLNQNMNFRPSVQEPEAIKNNVIKKSKKNHKEAVDEVKSDLESEQEPS